MTQQEIKALAREVVGDGQSPNLYFVSASPYFRMFGDGCDEYGSDRILEGFDAERDQRTYGPFNSLEEATEKYNDLDLDPDDGVGQVFIEDRETGTVREKWLEGRIDISYNYNEY